MVTRETLLRDLYKGTELEKYAKYFYYGFEGSEWSDNPLGHFCDGLWGNQETVESLNYFEDLYNKGKAEFIFTNKDNPDVNIALMKQDKPSKVAILCAGGGYGSVATAVEVSKIGQHLHELGWTVAMLAYSIKEKAVGDKSLDDLILAVNYLKNNEKKFNIDMSNYIVGGCSAGGHLSSRLGTNNCGYKARNFEKPGLIFLAYPVIDFGENMHGQSRRMVLGENPSKEDIDKVSTHKHVDSSYPPVFMWQCDQDSAIGVIHTKLMEEALKKANVPYKYEVYHSTAHGWGYAKGQPAEGWVDRMLDFYKELYK